MSKAKTPSHLLAQWVAETVFLLMTWLLLWEFFGWKAALGLCLLVMFIVHVLRTAIHEQE